MNGQSALFRADGIRHTPDYRLEFAPIKGDTAPMRHEDTNGAETMKTTYSYPINGSYNETVATLEDGRKVTINTQYGKVFPHSDHADDCIQVNRMGGTCSCGLLAGIDTDALIADARANGLTGAAPRKPLSAAQIAAADAVDASEARINRAMTLNGHTY